MQHFSYIFNPELDLTKITPNEVFVFEIIASLIPTFNKLVWVSEFLFIVSARYVSVRVHLFSLEPVSAW